MKVPVCLCPWLLPGPRFMPADALDALLDGLPGELALEDCGLLVGVVAEPVDVCVVAEPVDVCVVGVRVGVGVGFVTWVPCRTGDPLVDPVLAGPVLAGPALAGPDLTFDAPDEVAEAGDEDDDGGGVGSLHGSGVALVRAVRSLLVVLPALVFMPVFAEAFEVVGVAERVGVAVCVGVVVSGGVVAGVLGVVGADVTVGVAAAPLDWFGAGLALVSGRLGELQEGVGVALTALVPPLAPAPPLPTGWPLPLVPPGAPPPLPDVDPLFEDEPMLVIACRKPGTAMAVPVKSSTAASAMAGLSHTVVSRSRTVCAPVLVAATARRPAVEIPAAAVAARTAALAPHR